MNKVVFPKNKEKAEQMAAYMKNLFPFAGVTAPERAVLEKELLKESKKLPFIELFDLISFYYHKPEREYQYLAIDLATVNVKRFSLEEVLHFKPFVIDKAWWDSVDSWRKFFGLWGFQNLEEMPQLFEAFFGEKDFWHRRIAINLQLLYKEKTNTVLLKKAIIYDKTTDEFFIQKSIGWSLRQYSKTDHLWVQTLIKTTELSPLAVREGSKYLPKP
ncbi:DNA alkylation repair protein [Enterococcus haemoperoxidus ATCC BAA-382]|uniref:DNA alkylation repair protein n=1 Tax=Enterococcus haemoperoxidus ATCC BAA-382 TaxID=1158608 RepID=R2QKL9_9ENTE|nr:DNA alkylation repair protein [Enterococcus haemoperoxidus]EOH97137.1 DNA alkylation repair protein [Enterococcus haemoperoxidus ATCC BAA-382]EOT59950.1 DNA alkylation repair protein [Enterococcus haemoperoxidus ATCC BAA-382]OJG56131.1 DNA alkylation repair protein [Enterococcus haemoperoxidus]